MQKLWVKNSSCQRLLIVALGWAADPQSVGYFTAGDCDTLYLFDYRELERISDSELIGYKKITLLAWSFGVWASEYIFDDNDLRKKIDRAIAVNGTPLPVNAKYGIHPKSLSITLRGMQRSGIKEFNLRAYGIFYTEMAQYLVTHSLDEKLSELETLIQMGSLEYTPKIEWTRAIIGDEDLIFSPQNIEAYWNLNNTPTTHYIDMPHYPFGHTNSLTHYLFDEPNR